MKTSRLNTILAAIGIFAVLGAFQNCGNVNFAAKAGDEASLGNPTAGPSPTPTPVPAPNPPVNPPVICDPFAPSNNIDPKLGIEGSLHYTADRIPAANCSGNRCTSRDYISMGTKVDAKLFMSQVFVPTRAFSDGFDVQGYGKLKDQANNDLVEWFALDLQSNITLGTADEDGMYQFGAISDDGITLTANGQDILVDEGEHSPRVSCASQVVPLKKGDLLPFRFTYFQGPRTQIALVLMWRKIDAQSLTDCGSSDGYFTDQNNLPASLATRGWKVLKPENFRLKDGYNLCSMK